MVVILSWVTMPLVRLYERGSIKIRTTKGEVRTLMNVRHVPQLRKNLISLGVLNKGWFNFSGSDGEYVCGKVQILGLRAKKWGILYVV